jgi:hypothetical protein
MVLLLLVVDLGMIQIGSYRDVEVGVASRILRNRLILGRLYMGWEVRVWKWWEFEVGDLKKLVVWLLVRMAGRAELGLVQLGQWWRWR